MQRGDGKLRVRRTRTNSPKLTALTMMKGLPGLQEDLAKRHNLQIILICTALAAGIFSIDVASLPLGVAAGMAYVAVVLISLWLPRWQYSFVAAAGVSVLTILGYFLSEPAGIPWMAVANRLLALATIWLTAITGSWLVITKRRKVEDALRMQESFSDTLFESAPAVVLLLDPKGRITGINPYLEQVSGFGIKEVLGKYWFEPFVAETEEPVSAEFLQEVSGGVAGARDTRAIITKSGGQRLIEWRGTTLRDAAGKIVGYMNVGQDVTAQNACEIALQSAEQEADRARKAKSRFLDTTSNDLRHHFQTLSLLNGTLRRTVTDTKTKEILAMQGEALAHVSDLLNSILELSKLESKDVEMEIAEIPIDEVFQQLQDEFEHQAEAKGLQVHFDYQRHVAYSDRLLLKRIVRILLTNAIRYTNQGVISVRCRPEDDGLKITVQDSGIGIAPDQLNRIFDEFYRIDNDPVGRNGGLGLGLSIVDRSVNLLGTQMEVESELGRGSSFSFVVPAAAATDPE